MNATVAYRNRSAASMTKATRGIARLTYTVFDRLSDGAHGVGQKRGRGGSVGGRACAFERSGSQITDCSNMAPHLAPSLSASEPQAGDRILVFRPQWLSLVLSGRKKVEVRGAAYKSGSYYLGHAFFCVVIRCNDGWPAAPGCCTGARLAMCLSPAVVRCVRVCYLIRQAPEV